jgi:hypothetical protein
MAKKPFNDIIDTLPAMVAGRLDTCDFAALADLPDGIQTIDLLNGAAQHSSGAAPQLSASGLFAAWFDQRLQAAKFERSALIKAVVTVAIRTDRVAADRARIVPFDLISKAEIETADRSYVSHPASALRSYRCSDGTVTD